jgi:hypothetical protein
MNAQEETAEQKALPKKINSICFYLVISSIKKIGCANFQMLELPNFRYTHQYY